MVTNSRSVTSGVSVGCGLTVASGGISEGHMNIMSMRGCAPGFLCTLKRIAPGGTLNETPPTETGSDGASGETGRGAGQSM